MGNHESRINKKKNLNHVSREKNSPNHVSRKKYGGGTLFLKRSTFHFSRLCSIDSLIVINIIIIIIIIIDGVVSVNHKCFPYFIYITVASGALNVRHLILTSDIRLPYQAVLPVRQVLVGLQWSHSENKPLVKICGAWPGSRLVKRQKNSIVTVSYMGSGFLNIEQEM